MNKDQKWRRRRGKKGENREKEPPVARCQHVKRNFVRHRCEEKLRGAAREGGGSRTQVILGRKRMNFDIFVRL